LKVAAMTNVDKVFRPTATATRTDVAVDSSRIAVV
jgi:hypothetical protein